MSPKERIRRRAERHFHPHTVNFWCHIIEGALAVLGLQFASDVEVLPLLVKELNYSNTVVGVITALTTFSFLGPLILAPWMEAARRRKGAVMLLGIFMRVPMLLVGLSLLLAGLSAPFVCIVLISMSLLMRKLASSVINPMWMDLVAETIPQHRHGPFWGWRSFISAGLGLPFAFLAMWILDRFAFPRNYATLYFIAFGFMAMSWLVFALVDDVPDDIPERSREPVLSYLGSLGGTLVSDSNYRNFVFSQMLRQAAFAGLAFYAITAREFHGLSPGLVVAGLIVSRRIGRMVGPSLAPMLRARLGDTRTIEAGNLTAAASALIVAAAPQGNGWAVLVAAFVWSVGGSIRNIGTQSVALQLFPRGRRVGYQTLRMAAVAVTGMAAAPLLGMTMDLSLAAPHALTFAVVAAFNILACLPLEHFALPGEEPVPDIPGACKADSSG